MTELRGATYLMGSPGGRAGGRFDGHVHVFRADLPMRPGRRYTPAYDATPDRLAELLCGHGLDGALIVQPSFLGTDNSYLLATLAAAATRPGPIFRGVCALEAGTGQAEMQRLDAAGIVGMRINLFGQKTAFDPAEWAELLRRADGLGWHVEIYCEGARLSAILGAVSRFCRKLVVDHFGMPETADPAGYADWITVPERLFVKITAPYRLFPEHKPDVAATLCSPLFRYLYDELGPERLVWGSDWPWTRFEGRHDYGDTLAWFGERKAVQEAIRQVQNGFEPG